MARVILGVALGLMTLGLLGASRGEAVVCGDTVAPRSSLTLTANLTDCTTQSALTVQGPAILDLAGHVVSCNQSGGGVIGINVVGSGAVVRNGRVLKCAEGVSVHGTGGHLIKNVLANDNELGFVVASAKNVLTNNGASANGTGFWVSSGGNGNGLLLNTAVSNIGDGFNLQGVSGNVLRSNTATSNADGFVLVAASGNGLVANEAFANATYGILLTNEFPTNSSKNAVEANVSLGNAVDLEDDAPSCDGNGWIGNVFGSRNVICIH